MELKIISDGTIAGSSVVNATTGERVENVELVEFKIDAQLGVSGVIRFTSLRVDMRIIVPPVIA